MPHCCNSCDESTRDAHAKSERIEAAIKTAGSGDYPPFGLARDLRTVAQLIRADVGIRIFLVELGGGGLGGFDNHANQLGNHCALLQSIGRVGGGLRLRSPAATSSWIGSC